MKASLSRCQGRSRLPRHHGQSRPGPGPPRRARQYRAGPGRAGPGRIEQRTALAVSASRKCACADWAQPPAPRPPRRTLEGLTPAPAAADQSGAPAPLPPTSPASPFRACAAALPDRHRPLRNAPPPAAAAGDWLGAASARATQRQAQVGRGGVARDWPAPARANGSRAAGFKRCGARKGAVSARGAVREKLEDTARAAALAFAAAARHGPQADLLLR